MENLTDHHKPVLMRIGDKNVTDASIQNWHVLENGIKHALMRFQCASYVHMYNIRHLHKYYLQAIPISPNRKCKIWLYIFRWSMYIYHITYRW